MRFPAAAVLLFGVLAGPAAEAKPLTEVVQKSGIQGGLVVHLGTADADQIASLRLNERFVVQGLDGDAARVAAARKRLREKGRPATVTVIAHRGPTLPYVDNAVNLLVADDSTGATIDEMMRVLAPGGVAMIRGVRSQGSGVKSEKTEIGGAVWSKIVKPWPKDIDQWTHFLHEPDNNAVARDTQVAPPHHLQWTAGPRWGRTHDHLHSMSAAVSAKGRLFYIVDEGSIASVNEPSRWRLVARDAFSGVLLWKKEISPWEDRLRPFRSGPAEMPRRLVAVDDRVFVTLGYGKPVTALNAATGEVVHTYAGTENTHEILFHEGKLYLVVSDPLPKESGTTGEVLRRLQLWRGAYGRYVTRYMKKHLQCLQADTGKVVWKKKDADAENVLPLTTALADARLFFENEKQIVALAADSGEVLWKTDRPVALHRYAWSAPTLVVTDGVVLSADRAPEENLDTEGGDKTKLEWLVTANHLLTSGEIMAFSAKTGKKLWTAPCHEGFNVPVDLFVIDGKVYSGVLAWGRQPGITQVYDLHTGKVVARRPPDQGCYTIGFGHHRCYRNKATTKYILHGRSGVEFVDLGSSRVFADHWVRGTCQYGILPCNGLLYAPPHSCACYITAKLNGFNALAAKRDEGRGTRDRGGEKREEGGEKEQEAIVFHVQQPEKGPAYEEVRGRKPWVRKGDWPTYRHDVARSGATDVSLSPQLKKGWEQAFAGPLTAVVVAEDKVLFAQKDLHTVHAVSAADGKPIWSFTAGGRVDSPPTVFGGCAYFGSADGWVYCVQLSDGRLCWRFRASRQSRQLVSYEQLESVWPVHGTPLIVPGKNTVAFPAMVIVVAGRSSFLDGGLYLYQVDAITGYQYNQERISHRD